LLRLTASGLTEDKLEQNKTEQDQALQVTNYCNQLKKDKTVTQRAECARR